MLFLRVLLFSWLAGIAGVASAAPERAQCQGDCVPIGQWSFRLSLGYGMRSNPVINQDDITFVVVPEFNYYGKRFFIDDYDVGYTLYDKGNHQLNGILITPGFEQNFFNRLNISHFSLKQSEVNADSVDASQDRPQAESNIKLNKRRTAGLSGIEYVYIHPNFDWQTQILQDVTKIHHGQKVRTAISIPWQQGKNHYKFSTGLFWQSHKLIHYYYGLEANEVSDPNLIYQGGSSTAAFIKGEWERHINKRWSIRGLVSYKWLGRGVTDSPLVEDKNVTTGFVAGVYHF